MTALALYEPIKRILARCIVDALPDAEEARERLRIAVADGHFDEDEARAIGTLIGCLEVAE